MSAKLEVVLTWAERIATAVSIAVPAIRQVAAVLTANPPEGVLVSNDEN